MNFFVALEVQTRRNFEKYLVIFDAESEFICSESTLELYGRELLF